MDRQTPSDDPGRNRSGILSWPAGMAFWAVVSVVGWVALAIALTILVPGDTDKVATDKEGLKEIRKIAPAAGARGSKAD